MNETGDGTLYRVETVGSAGSGAYLGFFGNAKYIVERRYFKRFLRERVPAKDVVKREPAFQNEIRDQRAGPLCFKEGLFRDRILRQEFSLVLGYYELWRINVSRKEYFDTVLGPEVTLSTAPVTLGGIAYPWLTGAEISLTAEAGAASAGGLVGAFGEAFLVVGAGLAGYLVGTAVARELTDGRVPYTNATEERLDSGWEIVDRVLTREPTMTQGEPYWQRVTPIYECQAPTVTILNPGSATVEKFGGLVPELRTPLESTPRLEKLQKTDVAGLTGTTTGSEE